MVGISDRALGKLDSKNKFNGGSDFEEDYGVNLYTTFFRNYDPQIGRFDGVDMLSERFHTLNAYQFGANNPVMLNDPAGARVQGPPDPGSPAWDLASQIPNSMQMGTYMDQWMADDDAFWSNFHTSSGGGGGNYAGFYDNLFNKVSDNGKANFSDFAAHYGTNKYGQSGMWISYNGSLNDGVYGGFGNETTLNSVFFGKYFVADFGDMSRGPIMSLDRLFSPNFLQTGNYTPSSGVQNDGPHYAIGGQVSGALGFNKTGIVASFGFLVKSDLSFDIFFSTAKPDPNDASSAMYDASMNEQVIAAYSPDGNLNTFGDGKTQSWSLDPVSLSVSRDAGENNIVVGAGGSEGAGVTFGSGLNSETHGASFVPVSIGPINSWIPIFY